jgi:hypothetical protein
VSSSSLATYMEMGTTRSPPHGYILMEASRDAVALVQEKEGLTFWPAVRVLEKRYGLPALPWEPGDDDRPPTPKEEVEEALDRSETPEQALGRVSRFLENLVKERELTAQACAGLWEAFDRVSALHFKEEAGGKAIVSASHKILASAKQRLRDASKGLDL